ncbi:MAG: response regulator [Sulfurimonas sp.]
MPTILLCDDEIMNRQVASKILHKEGFDVIETDNAIEAIQIAKSTTIDLILMDLMMPVMDGYEATRIIKNDEELSTIPLIIISALSDHESIIKGLELGADDHLTKPFNLIDFRLRIKNAIKIGMYQNMLKEHKLLLEKQVNEKTIKLQSALLEVQNNEKDILSILSKTAEYRDNETSEHTIRVGEMAASMARKFGWDEERVELMRLAAPMHDIGKVGIEDNILLKPGKLDQDEFSKMKKHAEIGYSILSKKETPLLKLAAEIAYSHHEKHNGSGYPRGLKADEIPISGAIVAVIDVFDALLSKRPYKKPFTLEQTLEIINTDSGSHFHPHVVDLLVNNINEFIDIRQKINNA